MKSKPETLEQLAEKFDTKITRLREKMQLIEAGEDPTCQELTVAVHKTVKEIDVLFAIMRSELRRQKEALETVKKMKTEVATQQDQIKHMKENLPVHLPNMKPPAPEKQATQPAPLNPMPVPQHGSSKGYLETPTSTCSPVRKTRIGSSITTPVPSSEAIKRSALAMWTCHIDYLTVEEFGLIPKYMKGRHSYEQVNRAIDEFNKALKAKYKILQTAKSKQNEPIKRQIRAYKEQENKDVKGQRFIVEKDLIDNSNLKIDNVGRSMLTMMRHCRRIKEVRGQGLTRYVLMPR